MIGLIASRHLFVIGIHSCFLVGLSLLFLLLVSLFSGLLGLGIVPLAALCNGLHGAILLGLLLALGRGLKILRLGKEGYSNLTKIFLYNKLVPAAFAS